MSGRKLRVYVWTEYARDWSTGMAVAIAHDADEARDLIAEEAGHRYGDLARRPDHIAEFDGKPRAFQVTGGS